MDDHDEMSTSNQTGDTTRPLDAPFPGQHDAAKHARGVIYPAVGDAPPPGYDRHRIIMNDRAIGPDEWSRRSLELRLESVAYGECSVCGGGLRFGGYDYAERAYWHVSHAGDCRTTLEAIAAHLIEHGLTVDEDDDRMVEVWADLPLSDARVVKGGADDGA